MDTNKSVEKGNAIQFVPDTMDEWEEIKRAADGQKRSLASFCLISSLESARKVNASTSHQ